MNKIEEMAQEIAENELRNPHFYDPPTEAQEPAMVHKTRDVVVEITHIRGGHGEWVPVVAEREV